MDELFEKSLRTLELPRVLEKLAAQATSEAAKAKARALLPQTDVEDVKRLQQETSAGLHAAGPAGQPVLCRSKGCVCRAGQGAARRYAEHAGIAGYCSASAVRPPVKDYRGDESDRDTVLDTMFRALHGGRFLEDRITRAIPEENEIADNASAELADIRRHMHAAGRPLPADPAENHLIAHLFQSPAGEPDHPAGRPLCGAGESGVPQRGSGTGSRRVVFGRHGVCRTDGCGAGQQ